MENSIQNYRFTYDAEPSDEHLAIIMKEVAEEAKRKAIEANSAFMSNLSEQIRIAKQKQNISDRHSHETAQA